MRAAKAGDRSALESLFARYLPWLRQSVALRLGMPLRACAGIDDIVQQSLLDAFLGIHGFEPRSEGSFRNWLMTIAVNNARDTERRERRRPAVPLPETGIVGDGTSPTQGARAAELEERIEGALLALSSTHREILMLRERCAMEFAEIAAEMGFKNADTARALHHRALARLREQLDENAAGADGSR